ncbi:hypothetical protein [Streptomyces cyaneofuscatus]|uniref:hypothetical protein n=1 Tax=Streptomyces cyaneofuscatus TaxID=66883 RepID=UPI00364F0547
MAATAFPFVATSDPRGWSWSPPDGQVADQSPATHTEDIARTEDPRAFAARLRDVLAAT